MLAKASLTSWTRPSEPRFVSDQVPLYYQLQSILADKILSGFFSIDQQMPTEAELEADYGVSRITVRQALRILEEKGLIRREPGRNFRQHSAAC
jgi:DNA-binding GntR family transcriptional regulator